MSLQIESQPFIFEQSLNAASLSGTHYGDGSYLTGITTVVNGTANQINASKTGTAVTLSLPSSAIFPGNVSIIGNLTIAGSATYIDTKNLVVGDNIIYFNDNNYGSNVLDMGIVSHFSQAPLGYNHTGLIRRAGQGNPGVWTLFSGLTTEPASATNIDWNDKNIVIDTLSANLIGNLSGSYITVGNGNSNNWNSVYTTVNSNSATTWNYQGSDVKALSGNWQSTYSSVSSLSGNWSNVYNYVNTTSATNNPTYNVTAFAKLSAQLYRAGSGLNSIQPINGANCATASYSNVAGGNSNCASGGYSNVAGGNCNCATALYSNVAGGQCNTASGWYSIIAGGAGNTASGYRSAIFGGLFNSVSGYASSINGSNNTVSGGYSNVTGGIFNRIPSSCSNIAGGYCNTASGDFSAIIGGKYATTTQTGEVAHSNSLFGTTNGSFQHSIFTASTVTTNATPTKLSLDGSTTYFYVPSGTSYFFNINVLAYNMSTTLAGSFTFKGFVKNPTGTITLSPNTVQEVITEDNNISASVGVDSLNKYLTISVVGASAATVRWGAVVDTVKITSA